MDEKIFQLQAKELIAKYLPNYSLQYSRTKRAIAHCNYQKKTIFVSKYYVELLEWEVLHEILLHEIAHGMVGSGYGHNRIWQRQCRNLGIRPERKLNIDCIVTQDKEEKITQPKYKESCSSCGASHFLYRKPKIKRACKHCCDIYAYGRYSPDFVFKLEVLR